MNIRFNAPRVQLPQVDGNNNSNPAEIEDDEQQKGGGLPTGNGDVDGDDDNNGGDGNKGGTVDFMHINHKLRYRIDNLVIRADKLSEGLDDVVDGGDVVEVSPIDSPSASKSEDDGPWSLDVLKNTYHFTDEDIKIFFKKDGDNYVINHDNVEIFFGKEVNSMEDLMKLFEGEFPVGVVAGAYGLGGYDVEDNQKYYKYLIQTGANGSNNITFKLNLELIEQDFPGQDIKTIGQLKAAVDANQPATEADFAKAIEAYKEALINALKTAGDQGFGEGEYVLSDADLEKYLYWEGFETIDIPKLQEAYLKNGGSAEGIAEYLKTNLTGVVIGRVKNFDCCEWIQNATDGLKGSVIADLKSGKYADGYEFNDEDAEAIFNAALEAANQGQNIWTLIAQGKTVDEIKTAIRAAVDEVIKKSAAETATRRAASEDTTPADNAKNAHDALVKSETGVRSNRVSATINDLESEYNDKYGKRTVNTGFKATSNGKIQSFNDPYVKTMFDDLFAHIKEIVGTDGFDEATLKQLYESAWKMTYSSVPANKANDISDFLTKVYNNFKDILGRIQEKPEFLDIFTGKTEAYVNNTGNSSNVNLKNYFKYSDGSVHLSDNKEDVSFQNMVNKLFENLKKAYPDVSESTLKSIMDRAVDKALSNIIELSTVGIPSFMVSSFNIQTSLSNICTNVLVYFEQELLNKAMNDNTLLNGNPKPEETNTGNRTQEDIDSIKEKYEKAAEIIGTVLGTIGIDSFVINNNCNGYHWLEMDIDSSGNINFSDDATKRAFDVLFDRITTNYNFNKSGLSEAEFKQVYLAAWMGVYQNRDNNQKYDMTTIIKEVINNITKVLDNIAEEPKYLDLIQNGSAMSQVTDDKTAIRYDDTNPELNYGDGNIHLNNDESDKKYQKAVNELKAKLRKQYCPPLNETQFNNWFKQAQKDAFNACAENSRDITKGLQISGGTRSGDDWWITIGQLMELIAYKFDKYIFNAVVNKVHLDSK